MSTLTTIPTAISPAEARALRVFSRGMRVIECGALLGYSTLLLAEQAASVVSIDRHEGYGPSTLAPYLSNIASRRDMIVPVVADCRAVLPFLTGDRYFLDLDGTYATTRGALTAIRDHGVLVAVHDFRRQCCDGVARAILDAGYDIEQVVDSLAIVVRR